MFINVYKETSMLTTELMKLFVLWKVDLIEKIDA